MARIQRGSMMYSDSFSIFIKSQLKMKKIVILPLVLSAGVLMSACGDTTDEPISDIDVQNQVSEQLDVIIANKEIVATPEGEVPAVDPSADPAMDAGAPDVIDTPEVVPAEKVVPAEETKRSL